MDRQPAPSWGGPAAGSPVLLVASISDALAGKWPPFLQPRVGTGAERPPICRTSFAPMPASALLSVASPQQPDLGAFQLHGGRRSSSSGGGQHGQHPSPLAAAHHIQAFMAAQHAALDPHQAGHNLFTAVHQHAVVPLVAFGAMLQHHAAHVMAERLRALRQHLRRHGRSPGEHSEGISSILQTSGPKPPRTAGRLYDTARQFERNLDPLAAAAAFVAAAEADARQAEWLSLAAKNYSDASYLPGTPVAEAQHLNRMGIDLATQAMAAAPDAAHSYIARCVSRGRLALLCDNRTKVHLAREACDDAARALELEPRNDYAHHLMGRWHYEMAGLNAVARTLVRLLFGASLMAGSYTAALDHYRTATQLSPRTLVHRVELGRTLAKLGHSEEAVQELQTAVQLPIDDLNAHLQRLDAEELLCKLVASPGVCSTRVLAAHTAAVQATAAAQAAGGGQAASSA